MFLKSYGCIVLNLIEQIAALTTKIWLQPVKIKDTLLLLTTFFFVEKQKSYDPMF